MAELLTPGVFIQEVDFGPQPIEGVSTSTAGFVGEAERGPTSGEPILVTSFSDYQREFGGFLEDKFLAHAVRGFFDNGGRRAYVARVAGSDADVALVDVQQGVVYARVQEITPSFDPGDGSVTGLTVTLSSVVGLNTGDSVDFETRSGASIATATVQSVNGPAGAVTFSPAGLTPADVQALQANDALALIPTATGAGLLTVEARSVGAHGNRLSALIAAGYGATATILAQDAGNSQLLTLSSIPPGLQVGDQVQLENNGGGNVRQIGAVAAIDAAARQVTLAADPAPWSLNANDRLMVIEWTLTVFDLNQVVEVVSGLSAAVDGSANAVRFQQGVESRSRLVRIADAPKLNPAADLFPTFAGLSPGQLAGGADGTALDTDIVGQDTTFRSGLKALEAQQGINIIAAPGRAELTVVNEMISQCERLQDRFAVFETDRSLADVEKASVADIKTFRANFNSRYAAMYYPWLRVVETGAKQVLIPPSGHVLGAYARTDNDRGVFKSPANVVVRNILGFSVDVPDGQQDLLNPDGVNVLRRQEGLGNVIWGARTISSESLWRYVSVRRLFIFLEQSIVRGTRFAVFEPNAPPLWARLHDAITNFLTSQWRAGALVGTKPEEAFFVKVDETTVTQDDRDNGRVNIIIGLAPSKPAEFIVIQIGQAPSSVIVAES